jgi:hypothetical protein
MSSMRVKVCSTAVVAFAGLAAGAAVAAPSVGPAMPPTVVPIGSWLEPENVAGGDIDASSMDFDIDRTSGVAVWRVLDGEVWRVQVAERDGPRSWLAPVTVSAAGVATDTPRAAKLWTYSDYDQELREYLVVVWSAFDGAHWRIQYAIKDLDESSWSDPRMLSAAGQDAAEPVVDLAYGYTGENWVQVVWRRFDGSHWRVETTGVAGAATPSPARYLSPPGQDVQDLTNEPSVAWTQFDGTNWRAQAAHKDERSDYLRPGVPVSPPGEDAFAPSVLGAAFWRMYDGTHWRIRVSHQRNDGTWDTPTFLSPAGTDAEAPTVGGRTQKCDDLGQPSLVATWRQHDGTNWRVAWRAYTDDWSPMHFLSEAGHDASSPEMRGCGLVAAWTEAASSHPVAKASDLSINTENPSIANLSGVDADVEGVGVRDTSVAWLDATISPNALRLATLDKIGPYANLSIPAAQNGELRPAVWWAHDDWSKIAGFDVNQRRIRWDATEWTSKRLLTNTPERSWAGPFRPGSTYCFRVRARDAVGNTGFWAIRRPCTVTPLDERRLLRTGKWEALQGSRYFRGTFLRTRQQGATLSLSHLTGVQRIGVLVATGPGNGRIRLWFRGYPLRVIDLDTPTRRWLVVPRLIPTGPAGRLTLEVISRDKHVRIDGVYIGKG